MTDYQPLTENDVFWLDDETDMVFYHKAETSDYETKVVTLPKVQFAVEGLKYDFCMYAQSSTGRRGCVSMGQCVNCIRIDKWFPVFTEKEEQR